MENEKRWSTFQQEVEAAITAGKFPGVQLTSTEGQHGYWLGGLERSKTFAVEYDTEADLMNLAKNLQNTYQQDAVMTVADGTGATQLTTSITNRDVAIRALKDCCVKAATVYDDRVKIVVKNKKQERKAKAFSERAKREGFGSLPDIKSVWQSFANYGDDKPVQEEQRPRQKYPDDRK